MKDLSIVDHYDGMDIDELEFELEDLNRAIENEMSWLTDAFGLETKQVAKENIRKLKEERAYVRKLIRELMCE